MKLSRDFSLKLNYFLDQFIPPIIRDSKWFVKIPFKILFKDKANTFLEFKQKALKMDGKEYTDMYKKIGPVLLQDETDLNNNCIKEILKNIEGKTILDVGCGRCFLAKKLSKKYKVTASDIVIDPNLQKNCANINFVEAKIEKLPFKDNSFDTTICTHTLEHIIDISQAIKELRRVTKKRLIIVVPKQRPYKYTFNLHLHFFPYEHSLLFIMGKEKNNLCKDIDGDWFYAEDLV